MKRAALLAAAAAVLALPPAAAAKPHLSSADSKAIAAVLTRYIPAALERKDLRLAYELSGPQIRGGMSLQEWLHGGIPVLPFPARGDEVEGWVLKWASPGDVGLDLLVQPRKSSGIGPIAFNIQMTKSNGRWLVNSFWPQAMFSEAGKEPKVFSERDLLPGGSSAAAVRGRLSPLWFAVPGGILLSAIVLVPLGYFVYVRRRDARHFREYLQLHGET